MANIEKTLSAGLKIGGTALVYTVAAETLLNRTSLSAPAKGAAAGGVALVSGVALAGHAPNIAAGLIVGGVVYLGQTAARASRLDAMVDKWISATPATAQAAAAAQNAPTTQTQPAANPTPGQLPQPVQTGPSAGIPGRSRVYVNAAGQLRAA